MGSTVQVLDHDLLLHDVDYIPTRGCCLQNHLHDLLPPLHVDLPGDYDLDNI